MVEPTSESESLESTRPTSNRSTYIIIAAFVVALTLLLALNWN